MALQRVRSNMLANNFTLDDDQGLVVGSGNNIYIDTVNNRVGINTSSPTHDFTVSGNIHATGNITASGDIQLGDSDADTITISAEIGSDILPDVTNTYDLGSASKVWAEVHATTFYGDGSALTGLTSTLNDVLVNGNTTALNIVSTGDITATNFIGDGSQLTGLASTLNDILGNGNTTALNIVSTGDITAANFIGNGSQLTGLASTLDEVTTNGATTTNSITVGDLTVNSTNAIGLPVGTTAQRPTAANGLMRFNSTLLEFEGYNGTEWGALGGGGATYSTSAPTVNLSEGDLWFDTGTTGELYVYSGTEWLSVTGAGGTAFYQRSFTGDNSTTVFNVYGTGSATVLVYINGIFVTSPDDYSYSAGSVTFVTAPALNDEINVLVYGATTGFSLDINSLTDVSASSPTSGQVLKWNGTSWTPQADNSPTGDANRIVYDLADPSNSVVLTSGDAVTPAQFTGNIKGDVLKLDGTVIVDVSSTTATFNGGLAGAVYGDVYNPTGTVKILESGSGSNDSQLDIDTLNATTTNITGIATFTGSSADFTGTTTMGSWNGPVYDRTGGTLIIEDNASPSPIVHANLDGNVTGDLTGDVTGTVSDISNHLIDEDTMASNDATKVPSQQSVKAYVDTEVAGLVDSAPGTLDTLNELAAALGDDPNFATTITNNIATKLPLAGGTLTGNLTMENTDAGSAAGPEFTLFRNSASAADADYLGQIKFDGKNDAGQSIVYAKITGKILDAVDGTEDGIIEIAHKKAGNNNISARFRSDSLQLINGTNLTVAGTTDLTGDLTVDTNTLHVDTTNNRVGIGTTSPFTRAVVGGGSGTEVLTIFSGSNGEGQIRFADGSSGSAAYQGRVEYDHVNGRLNLGAGGTTPFTIDSNSNVGIGTNSPNNYSGFTSLGINGSTGGVVEFMDDDAVIGEVFSGADYLAMGTTVAGGNLRFRTGSGSEKVRITSDGNVGIGDLTPSAKLEVAGTVKADQYLLDAIAKDISDTAVDVFIYDTRKDSDGGAWRKRTQHTSWYNETLNTATRGARKEFPAVAVIVLEAGGPTEGTSVDFTIYDGDDPDMPMWMQYRFIIGSGSNTGIAALNGIITFGCTDNGVLISDFVKDRMRLHNHVHRHTYGSIAPGRLGRSTVADVLEASVTGYSIVSQVVNDVAMTVLPNAPIDAATGLPVPTIAVATGGGVSVIKDDGTVISTVSDTGYKVRNIDLQSNGNLFAVLSNSSDANYSVVWAENYTGISGLSWSTYTNWNSIGGFYYANVYGSNLTYIGGNSGGTINDLSVNAIGSFYGLTKTDKNPSDFDAGLVNFISSNYNTGWMNGDIKLATLSDTDATNVTDANLVTNGTFDSNINGWTSSGAAISWDPSGRLKLVSASGNNPAYYPISCEIGKRYHVQLDFEGSWSFHLGTTTNSANDVGYIPHEGITGNVTRYMFFTATQTTHYLVPYAIGANTVYIDNVSVTLAEDDRSVNGGYNGNGLQVFGTVTKTAVATGADLVGYSGFSANTNYLEQPYNSDLDFGTGDYCVMCWFNSTLTSGAGYLFDRSDSNGYNRIAAYLQTGGNVTTYNTNSSGTPSYESYANSWSSGVWHHYVHVRRGTNVYTYLDGRYLGEYSNSNSLSNSSATLTVGARYTKGETFVGKLALKRWSATAPSAEQIKKIYEDEKVLFQENAKATLYGSSDAVIALAYDDDTELLHAGTSAGRSVFQGLRRIDNTTDAVGAAISASNGMVAED